MNTMKKIIGFLLVISLLVCVSLSFVSCKGKGNEGENNEGEGGGEVNGGGNEQQPDENPSGDQPDTPAPVITDYTILVKGADGQPIADVPVKLIDSDKGMIPAKNTDAKGIVEFEGLQPGTYYAQLNWIPDGYLADLATKYEFDAEGYTEIVISRPTGYNVTVLYDFEPLVDIEVALYAYDSATGVAFDEPTATAKTNVNGLAAFDIKEGDYVAKAKLPAELTADPVYFNNEWTSDSIYAFHVLDGTSDYPFLLEFDEETNSAEIAVAAESKLYYSFRPSNNLILTVNGDDAVVYYEGTKYTAKDGVVSITFSGDFGFMAPPALIEIENAGEEDATFTAAYSYVEGSVNNPKVLADLADLEVAVAEGADNAVYYTWTATEAGTLTVSADKETAKLDLKTNTQYPDPAEDGSYTVALVVGEKVTIAVGTEVEDENHNVTYPADTITVTFVFDNGAS